MVKGIQRRLLSGLSLALALAPVSPAGAARSHSRPAPVQPWSDAEGSPPPPPSAPTGARPPAASHPALHAAKPGSYGSRSLFPRAGAQRVSREAQHHVVRTGDTLWDIAAHVLGTDDPRRVARYWPRIHRVNRAVIGPDPSLIRPGQVLELPRAGDA